MDAGVQLQDLAKATQADGPPETRSGHSKGTIHYLCLQATREGQASHAHVHEIIKGLERRGWNVILFEPSYAANQRAVSIAHKLLEFAGLQVRAWSSTPRPDLIYVRDHIGLLPSLIWSRLRRIPVVTEVNGSFADYTVAYPWMRAIQPFITAAGRLCLHLSKAVIAVTPQLCDWVQSQAREKPTFLVPNGANTNLFHPDVQRQENLPELYVTFVGAFAPWQGVETMLRAAGEPDWPPDVKLVMIGGGHEQPKVEKAAAEDQRIIYLGRRPYRAIPGLIAGALAGISVQTNPGGRTSHGLYPLKVFETLACGVPVIVTDFSGQRELVRDNKCGIVIPEADPSSLARSVAYLRQNPVERVEMGRCGRWTVEKGFSWQHSADTTETVINQVIGR